MPKDNKCPYCKNDKCKCKENCKCDDKCKCGCNDLKETYFDKFIDSILISESKRKDLSDSPLRERIKRHQERPINRIYFKG
jgi:hypothetical protein